jgi:hypothetical protein
MRLDLGFSRLAGLVFRVFFARTRVGIYYFSVGIEASVGLYLGFGLYFQLSLGAHASTIFCIHAQHYIGAAYVFVCVLLNNLEIDRATPSVSVYKSCTYL